MIKFNLTIRVLWLSSGIIALFCALAAVCNPGIYDGFVEAKYLYGTIAQDVMAIIVSAILMVIAFTAKESNYAFQAIGLGLSGFLFYAYGVYVIEQVYNFLYFGYMAVFSLSFFGIIYSLLLINRDAVSTASISTGQRRTSAITTLLIPAVFVPLWTIMLANLIAAGTRIENTYSVFIMDLCFIMPLFIVTAILCFRKNPLGIVMAPALFVLGFTLLFPVGLSEIISWLYQAETAKLNLPSFLLYDGLAVMFLILGIIHIRKVRFSAARGDQ